MIKFYMKFFDVLFPVSLGPLTYRCSDELSQFVKPGMIVNAPLKKRISQGVVIAESKEIPPVEVKDIQKVISDVPVLTDALLRLLRWMSVYYVTEQGLVLKSMLPKEALIKVKQRKRQTSSILNSGCVDYSFNSVNVDIHIVSQIIDSARKQIFKTFLLNAPSSVYEISLLGEILTGIRNIIILVPELSLINHLYHIFKERFRDRLCLFHSGLSRGRRSEAIGRILSGRVNIVLGTRSAIFAPMKKVSLIVVLQEHNSSYKQENIPCYNGRDVAVKRGYFDRATVLLSSICPSIESIYNCKKGKYTFLKPTCDIKRPRLKVIDMRFENLVKPYLTRTIINAALRHLKKEQKIMFVMNRRGHSSVLQCLDCGHREECPHCGVPLVFHKQDMSLKCHYCGYTSDYVTESCSVCKGFNLQLIGAGTQRIKEDIEKLIGMKTLRFDSDQIRRESKREKFASALLMDNYNIVVGTKLMTRRLSVSEKFSMAVILNTDQFLNLPDFRSAEKAFQEISSIADKLEPNGVLFVQTRMPQNYLYRYLKNYDYMSFSNEEISRRKSLRYPPYSKMLLLIFFSKRDLLKEASEVLRKISKDIEILGPLISEKKGKKEMNIVLRSSSPERLHSEARIFIQSFKDKREVKIKVDVDPINI